MTLGDALARATARLAEAGVESARLEAELLLAKACDDCARALLYAELDRELNDEQLAAFDANLARREQREPLAYVLGEWGFRRLTLKTDRRALIPRPETEIVVERALDHIRGDRGAARARRRHRNGRDRARDCRRGARPRGSLRWTCLQRRSPSRARTSS